MNLPPTTRPPARLVWEPGIEGRFMPTIPPPAPGRPERHLGPLVPLEEDLYVPPANEADPEDRPLTPALLSSIHRSEPSLAGAAVLALCLVFSMGMFVGWTMASRPAAACGGSR